MNDLHLLVDEAAREIRQRSRNQIEKDTAFKWAARAIAAYELFRSAPHLHRWIRDSQTYFDEALEHAALADESGEVLFAVREWMGRYIPHGML